MKILLLVGLLHASVLCHRQPVWGWNPSRDIDRAAHLAGLSQHVRDKLNQAAAKLDVGFSAGGDIPVLSTATRNLRLDYGIFRGRSALRPDDEDVAKSERSANIQQVHRPHDQRITTSDDSSARCIGRDDSGEDDNPDDVSELLRLHQELPKACLALLLLMEGRGDEAHEVVLGVTLENFREAEHAATHPPSNWSHLHPLSDYDDAVHSLLHRWEGDSVGEGNHTGWENAKYWACGGPNRLDGNDLGGHPVRRALAALASERAPNLVRLGVVAPNPCQHPILADGGSHRVVSVPPGCWDPIQFINVKRRMSLPVLHEECQTDECQACRREIHALECLEITLLIRCSLLGQAGRSSRDILAELLVG
jgi:hypothetical protein